MATSITRLPGDSSLCCVLPRRRRCNQAAISSSTLSFSPHDSDSTPVRGTQPGHPRGSAPPWLSDRAVVRACVKMRRIRRGFCEESTLFPTDCISSDTWNKRTKEMLRLYGLPFTFRYRVPLKHTGSNRLMHDSTTTSAKNIPSIQTPKNVGQKKFRIR